MSVGEVSRRAGSEHASFDRLTLADRPEPPSYLSFYHHHNNGQASWQNGPIVVEPYPYGRISGVIIVARPAKELVSNTSMHCATLSACPCGDILLTFLSNPFGSGYVLYCSFVFRVSISTFLQCSAMSHLGTTKESVTL